MLTSCATFNQVFSPSKDQKSKASKIISTQVTQDFIMNGKFVIFIKDKGFSGSLLWKSKDKLDIIKIFSPFNSLIATIKLNNINDQIIFELNDNKIVTKKNLNEIFIEEKNIFTLRRLLINPPLEFIEKNKLDLNINKWKVRLENRYEDNKIPQTIKFKKNDISLKLVITKWMN
jgi:outer membrane biogenesis lipoprotein LolB